MEHAFVEDIETWGSAGEMFDVVILDDGRVVAITATRIGVYEDRAAFEAGAARGIIDT